jgi:hypothetical protein
LYRDVGFTVDHVDRAYVIDVPAASAAPGGDEARARPPASGRA